MTQPTTTPAEIEALCKRLEESQERLMARRSGQLSATANYGNAGRGYCDPCLEPAGSACLEAAAKLREMAGALNGYRAAVSFISADSWDGGSDCMDILKAARTNDLGWDWAHKPDRVAEELAHIRPFIPALAGGSHG